MRAEPLNVWHGLTDIAGIVKSSEGHPGGCPFSLAFWEPPCGRREGAGSLRERGLGAAFPPFQQPAGRARNPPAIESAEKPSTWRKRGTDLPGFPTFRQAPGQSRNPPPIGMLKTPSLVLCQDLVQVKIRNFSLLAAGAAKRGTPQRLGRGRGKEGRWLRDGRLAFLDTPRFRGVSPWRGRLRSLRLGAARP